MGGRWTLALSVAAAGSLGLLIWRASAVNGATDTGAASPRVTIQVDAANGWQTGGLTVTAGTRLRLEVTAGEWTYWIGRSPLQPGTGDDYICANIMPVATCVEPMPYERKGALIGRIGGGDPFLVGQRNVIAATRDGLVELRINDPDSALHDNGGILTVTLGDAATDPYPGPTEAASIPSVAPTSAPTAESTDKPPEPGPTGASPTFPPPATTPTAVPTAVPDHALPRALPHTGGGGMAGDTGHATRWQVPRSGRAVCVQSLP